MLRNYQIMEILKKKVLIKRGGGVDSIDIENIRYKKRKGWQAFWKRKNY